MRHGRVSGLLDRGCRRQSNVLTGCQRAISALSAAAAQDFRHEQSGVRDPWVTRMVSLPATVVSTTLEGRLDWPDATLESGDALDVVARLKQESRRGRSTATSRS